MTWTIIKACRWIYKTLQGAFRPWQIALGITLGALAGLLPLGFGTLCVFMLILLINVNFGSASFSFGIFRLIAFALQMNVVRPLGREFLEILPQKPIITMARTPIVAWLRLDYFDVAGALALWLILCVPLFVASYLAYAKLQPKMHERIKKSKFLKWLNRLWLVKGLRHVFVG